jgi:polyisoprenoid-binding protein YceI
MKMKTLRNYIAIAFATVAVSALFGAYLLSGFTPNATAKAVDVKYAPIPAGAYNIDPAHSIIGFDVRHLEINWVEGRFKDFKGTVNFDDKDVTKSNVTFTAQIASVDTGVDARNAHLRTPDFFDAAQFPEMKFVSTKVEKKGKDKYILFGDLTIKGVTKSVSFPFTLTGAVKDPWGGTRFGINAETVINRRNYGITYGHPLAEGGLDVGDNITVKLQLEAVKPGPKPSTK